jgi:hypothetical protein
MTIAPRETRAMAVGLKCNLPTADYVHITLKTLLFLSTVEFIISSSEDLSPAYLRATPRESWSLLSMVFSTKTKYMNLPSAVMDTSPSPATFPGEPV